MTSASTRTDALATGSTIRVVRRRNFLVAGAALTTGTSVREGEALVRQVAETAGKSGQPVTEQDREYMRQAIRVARQAGVVDKTGGPFGAVVVRDGRILAATGNSVLRDCDPSAHAEVNAIRQACRELATPDITDAVLYSSCEPCPMCYSAAYWARIGKIYYAASWDDYADLFDDSQISADMSKPYPQRKVVVQQILREDARMVWREFRKIPDRPRY